MKKKRIPLFPTDEVNNREQRNTDKNQISDLRPGDIYRIGKPSSRYYQYIYPVTKPDLMRVDDFEDFKIIEGTVIRVISIIRLVNKDRIAVLMNYHGKPFMGTIEKIFADIDKSIASREILALDLETRRNLELAEIDNSK